MKRIWLIALVVGIAAVSAVVMVKLGGAKPAQTEVAQVVAVERGAVRKTVTADGTLRPLTTVSVKSNAGGKVVLLVVDVGDRVKRGQLIARIDPTDTQAAYTQAVATSQSTRAQLTEAQAQAAAQPDLTRAAVEQAQAAYDSAVASLRRLQTATQPREIADAKAGLDKARAAARAARESLARLTGSTHPVSRVQARADLDKTTAAFRQAEQDLRRLKASTQPRALAEATTALEKAKSDLTVAEKNLKRDQQLLAKGYVSQSEVDDCANKRDAAQAAYTSAAEYVRTVADDQSAEMRAAEEQVEQAKAGVAAAQKKWDSLDDDQSAERRIAEAAVQEAEADLVSAQRKWNTIHHDQAEALASARSAVDQARGALLSARAGAAQDRVKAAEVTNQQGQLMKAAASVAQTRTNLSYTTILAPRDGVVLKKDVEEGTIINSGQSGIAEGASLLELGDLSTIYVDVEVDETDLPDISVGQKVEMTVESVRDREIAGAVTRVDPQATTTSNITTVKVEIKVLDHDQRLLPGLTATCTFLAGEKQNVLTLPSKAIHRKDGKCYVNVVEGEQQAAKVRDVQVGLEGDDGVEIVSGLKEGDQVVLPQMGSPSTTDMGPPPPPGGGADFIKK